MDRAESIAGRTQAIRAAGGLDDALRCGALPRVALLPLVEAPVLGLMKQGVRKYLAVFSHGNTAFGEALRHCEAAGLVNTFQFRNEVAMSHAATQLSWQYGEISAVVTPISLGALQAFTGSLATQGVGVYHLYGDETTHGEGYNMQQIPRPRQGAYGVLTVATSGAPA